MMDDVANVLETKQNECKFWQTSISEGHFMLQRESKLGHGITIYLSFPHLSFLAVPHSVLRGDSLFCNLRVTANRVFLPGFSSVASPFPIKYRSCSLARKIGRRRRKEKKKKKRTENVKTNHFYFSSKLFFFSFLH